METYLVTTAVKFRLGPLFEFLSRSSIEFTESVKDAIAAIKVHGESAMDSFIKEAINIRRRELHLQLRTSFLQVCGLG